MSLWRFTALLQMKCSQISIITNINTNQINNLSCFRNGSSSMPICHWDVALEGQILCLSESRSKTLTLEDRMAQEWNYSLWNSIQIEKWQFSTGKNTRRHPETLQMWKMHLGVLVFQTICNYSATSEQYSQEGLGGEVILRASLKHIHI